MRSTTLCLIGLLASATVANAQETIRIGVPMGLSGPFATNGARSLKGLELAVEELNASGGVLGKKVEIVKADDAGTPASASTITRNMILNDGVKVIFGASTSATAMAEQALARQFKVPFMIYAGNDVALTASNFNVYSFQVQPSTYMEPRAVASYVTGLKMAKIFAIAPDFGFGHSYVENFVAGLRESGSAAEVVGQQFPALGTTDFSNYISAVIAAKPDFLFLGIFGGDLITFIKQAKGYGLFDKMTVGASTATDTLMTLKDEVPPGMILWGRAPFFSIKSDGIMAFAERYKKRFGEWPSEWPVLVHAAVQSWRHGVTAAGTFDGEKVSTALNGATISTLLGKITFRQCDHQADVPTYIGTASKDIDPRYGFRTLDNVFISEPSKTMMSCETAESSRRK